MIESVDRTVQQAEAKRVNDSIKTQDHDKTFSMQKIKQRPCPTCSKVMVRRTAKKASGTTSQFWGCTAYPACRTIITIE